MTATQQAPYGTARTLTATATPDLETFRELAADRRVIPVVRALSDAGAIVSIDTTRATVAEAIAEELSLLGVEAWMLSSDAGHA